MRWSWFLLGIFLLLLSTVESFPLMKESGSSTVEPFIGLYGETIMVPCPYKLLPGNELISTKWERLLDNGTTIDLLSKDADKDEADIYDPRFSISDDSSLLISQGTLTDQGLYACTVNTVELIWHQNFRNVVVYKKPSSPEITDKAKILEKGKLTTLGTCVAKDAMPAAEITWQKNGQPLVADGMDVIVTSAVKEDSTTGLLTTASSLQYTATREDVNASFSCLSNHKLGSAESEPLTVPVHYLTERLSLTAIPEGPYAEGDVVTLKCHGDGNPPPSSYNFHLKGQMVLVENSDSYTLPKITRDSAGEYKCSLVGIIVGVILGFVLLVAVAVVGMTVYWLRVKRQQGSSWMPGVKREKDRIYITTLKPDILDRRVEV